MSCLAAGCYYWWIAERWKLKETNYTGCIRFQWAHEKARSYFITLDSVFNSVISVRPATGCSKKISVRDAYVKGYGAIYCSKNGFIFHNRLSYWGCSPMNSSWGERFKGECNKSQTGCTEHNLMDLIEIHIIYKAGAVIRGRRSTRRRLELWMKKSINTNSKIYQRTVGANSITSSNILIKRVKVNVCQTVKTDSLSWLNVIGDLFECDFDYKRLY